MQLSPSALWVLVLPGCPSLLTYLPLWPVAVFLSSFPPSPPQEYIRHKLEEEQRQLEILQQQLLQEQALLLVQTLGHLPPLHWAHRGRCLARPRRWADPLNPSPGCGGWGCHLGEVSGSPSSFPPQEYKRKQLEEQRQSERLQRQLQQEHAYLKSLQQQQQLHKQQQQEKKPLYHYNRSSANPAEKPTWAREVCLTAVGCADSRRSLGTPQG